MITKEDYEVMGRVCGRCMPNNFSKQMASASICRRLPQERNLTETTIKQGGNKPKTTSDRKLRQDMCPHTYARHTRQSTQTLCVGVTPAVIQVTQPAERATQPNINTATLATNEALRSASSTHTVALYLPPMWQAA